VQTLPAIDVAVLAVYLLAVVGMGIWFARSNRSSKDFMAAGGALPGWAVGLSIFGWISFSINLPSYRRGWRISRS